MSTAKIRLHAIGTSTNRKESNPYISVRQYQGMLTREDRIEICRSNDTRYDGLFFMGVQSTGIFCIPSCTARFPKIEHIRFFETKKAAISAGYRGCRRCHAAEIQFQPPWIREVLFYLHSNLHQKIRMKHLEEITNISRGTITTSFQQYYNQTPLMYHRELRLKNAYHRIEQGEDYREVAYSSGFDSISGFRSAFQQLFNTTPGQV